MYCLSENIKLVRGCFWLLNFWSHCFLSDCAVKLLLYIEAGRTEKSHSWGNWFMTRAVMTFKSFESFSYDRTFLFWFQVFLTRSKWRIFRTSAKSCLFFHCYFNLSRFIMHTHRNRMKYFSWDCRRRFCLCREMMGAVRGQRLFVFIV